MKRKNYLITALIVLLMTACYIDDYEIIDTCLTSRDGDPAKFFYRFEETSIGFYSDSVYNIGDTIWMIKK